MAVFISDSFLEKGTLDYSSSVRVRAYFFYSGVAGVDHDWFVLLWAYGFLQYTGMEASKFASAPGPFEDRGEMAMACASSLFPSYAVHQMMSLCSLYSHSLRSCRPQPRGGRQDTRQDR